MPKSQREPFEEIEASAFDRRAIAKGKADLKAGKFSPLDHVSQRLTARSREVISKSKIS